MSLLALCKGDIRNFYAMNPKDAAIEHLNYIR